MLKRTVIVFLLSFALGISGLYLALGEAVFRPETYRVQSSGLLIVGLAIVSFLAKWLAPAVRVWLLCRGQKVYLSYRSAILAHLSAIFGAALAPQNTGFAPATVAALSRLGVPVGTGIGVAIQIAVLDLIFFAWSIPAGVVYLIRSGTLELLPGARGAAFAAAGLAVIAAVFLSRYPRLVVSLILAAARWRVMARFAPRLRRVARDYYRSMREFLRLPASYWSMLHLATAAGWFGGFVLLWALLRLYGSGAGLLATLAILNAITLISHFVPTPGAAGFVEAAVGLAVGPDGSPAALLIWRLAGFYMIFAVGPAAVWLLYSFTRNRK